MISNNNQSLSILHINDAITPGGSLVVMDSLINSVAFQNNRTHSVIAAPPDELSINLEKGSYYILRPKYNYFEHSQLIEKLKKKHHIIKKLNLLVFESKRFFFNLIYSFQLLRILKNGKYNIVHIHSATLPCIACIIAGIPYIYQLHGEVNAGVSKVGLKLMKRANKIAAISKFVAQTAIDYHLDPSKVQIIPNPIKPSDPPRRIEGYRTDHQDKIIIGHFGRVIRWKGQKEFIEAFALAFQKTPLIHAVIVGETTDGNEIYLEELKQLVKDYGLTDSIEFLGFRKNTQDYYNICDIVVHSSIEPEPFGLVIIEAMSMGKAVVVSSLGAAPEIVEHKYSGLVANPADKHELSDMLLELIRSEEMRVELGNNARMVANNKYHLEKIANDFLNVYQDEAK